MCLLLQARSQLNVFQPSFEIIDFLIELQFEIDELLFELLAL